MPEVSVIIPSYGVPDRLERTVSSVLNQTFQDLECIVVDDNNPDTENRKLTEQLMQRLQAKDPRVVYLRHEKNKNGSAARNTGLRAAKGNNISLLDSDDEYLPQRVEKCLKALKDNTDPRIKCVYTGCEYRRNNQPYRIMQNVRTGNFMAEFLAFDFNIYTGSNIFMEKAAADEIHGFDESFTRHQDVEFLIRYFEKYDILGIPDVLVIKNSDGKNTPSAVKFEGIKKHFLETFEPLIKTLTPEQQNRIYGANDRQLAEMFQREGNRRQARYYYDRVKKHGAYTMNARIRRLVNWSRSLRK